MRSAVFALSSAVASACTVPPACTALCAELTAAATTCAEESSWSSLGATSADDYRAWCDAWVLQEVLLAADANAGATGPECAERAAAVGTQSCDSLATTAVPPLAP